MKRSNILIINAVPSNNGDAALIFSLSNALKSKGYPVKIACQHYDLVKDLYPKENLVRELLDYPSLRKIPYNKYIKFLLTPVAFLFNKNFLFSQTIIASPGGYINSYYGFFKVALTLIVAKLLGKKTGIYSQSFGPLDKPDTLLMKFVSYFLDIIYARDRYSYDVLMNARIDTQKVELVEDGAFLIPFTHSKTDEKDTIAISVRTWKHDARDEEKYKAMIRSFVAALCQKGYKVEFLSTCQGLEGYIDDSKLASAITKELPSDVQTSVTVNTTYYTLDELRIYLEKFRAVIGTRLHMCILSLLSNKPSLNISYEVKGKQAYRYLGLDDFSIDYNEDLDAAMSKLNNFLTSDYFSGGIIEPLMKNQNKKAGDFLDLFLKRIQS